MTEEFIKEQNIFDTDLITEQPYWTTEEIKNSKLHFVFDDRVPKKRYDEDNFRRFQERAELQEQIEKLKQTIKTISKYFN